MAEKNIHTKENTGILTSFFIRLKSRNTILYYFGLFNFCGAVVTILLSQVDTVEIMGINRWIKPTKFFLSIGIVCWTMAWYLVYLTQQKAVRVYSIMTVITMLVELLIINGQSVRGTTSHFNISTSLDGILFNIMGIAILIFTVWTAYITYLFFQQKEFPIMLPQGYVWGIRLGLLFFVIFAFEGGQMAAQLAHSVGGPDGEDGLPLLNWSTLYGDLRVAHFTGMHALQVLPIAGYYFARTKMQIILASVVYLLFVLLLYWQALLGHPLL